jgi:Flp pilus assembly pilin Flp
MGVRRLRQAVERLSGSDSGQDLLEYALLVSLIVLAAMGAVGTLGVTLKTVFWDVISDAKF